MSVFFGGSAYNMVRDIAEGYIIVSERTFKAYKQQDLLDFSLELDKLLREIRGNQPDSTDTEAVQKRQRKMQRLQQALTIANGARSRLR